MKKIFLFVTLLAIAGSVTAQTKLDTLKVQELGEVVVKGVRVTKDAPYAVANIKKEQLEEFSSSGRELPMLFSQTPGIVAWGENGLGTGTTYMRIRGAAGSRINVTIDGVQLNSPEDQTVFWANMNSYASLLQSVQIQRGVGTSTNGDGAFGGNIALQTKSPSLTPTVTVTGSHGSYNTWNAGANFSTGLLWQHLVFDGAYHHTGTDGFIDGTNGNSGSYYGGLTWLEDNFQIKYKNIGNYEHTGQAWNGVTAGSDNYSLNSYDGVKTYKDMWNLGLGRFNSLYEHLNEYVDDDWNYHLATRGKGQYVVDRYEMNDGSFWPRTTDNFWQNHNILSGIWEVNPHLQTSLSLHYTYGYGYYEEFKYDCKLKKFGLVSDDISRSDFVRQKGLSQNTFGGVWNITYHEGGLNIIGGISAQQFVGNHFGYLTYCADDDLAKTILPGGKKYQYYDSDAQKTDANAFVKAQYTFECGLAFFGDLQYRFVRYKTDGVNDKFYKNEDTGKYYNQELNINQKFNFFNPKVGVSYTNGGHKVYGSMAISNREPERNNFTDNGNYDYPKAERLLDMELGYNFNSDVFQAGVNGYYMKYSNQLVQTGEKSDIGEDLTTNIKASYRLGVELSAAVNPVDWLSVYGNAALSQNKIKNFDEKVETYDEWWDDMDPTTVHYDNSTLAFSPSCILNGFLTLKKWGFNFTWHTNFVSRQYLDNTQNMDRSLPSYTQTDLSLNYHFGKKGCLKDAVIGFSLNNLFDAHYAASGWVYSAIVGSKYPEQSRYYQIGYVPMAGRNCMMNVSLTF